MPDRTVLPWIALLISIVSLAVASRAPETSGDLNSELQAVKIEQEGLRATLRDVQSEMTQLSIDKLVKDHSSANFSTTDQSFRLVGMAYGNLFVSLRNAEKFGDGYKLTFHIGNPTSMVICDVKGKVTWKPKTDLTKYYSDKAYKTEIDSKTMSKSFDIMEDLYPGVWNTVQVTIGPANEETIGVISIGELETNVVRMRTVNLSK